MSMCLVAGVRLDADIERLRSRMVAAWASVGLGPGGAALQGAGPGPSEPAPLHGEPLQGDAVGTAPAVGSARWAQQVRAQCLQEELASEARAARGHFKGGIFRPMGEGVSPSPSRQAQGPLQHLSLSQNSGRPRSDAGFGTQAAPARVHRYLRGPQARTSSTSPWVARRLARSTYTTLYTDQNGMRTTARWCSSLQRATSTMT